MAGQSGRDGEDTTAKERKGRVANGVTGCCPADANTDAARGDDWASSGGGCGREEEAGERDQEGRGRGDLHGDVCCVRWLFRDAREDNSEEF